MWHVSLAFGQQYTIGAMIGFKIKILLKLLFIFLTAIKPLDSSIVVIRFNFGLKYQFNIP